MHCIGIAIEWKCHKYAIGFAFYAKQKISHAQLRDENQTR